jgi:ribosome-associated toxin RatA of RatAB toxin-antitoxin module
VESETAITIDAPPRRVYALAAAVERWPQHLPHYRWVRVLARRGEHERLVEMAARRGRIPVWWRSVQRLDPERTGIEFVHVAGATRGMRAQWRIAPREDGTSAVAIWHAFHPRWPLVPDALVRLVVGEFFVSSIAGRTLARIKVLAEADDAWIDGARR